MEDVAVHVCHNDTVKSTLYGIDLIRSHDHQDRLCILDNEILAQHLRQMELRQECIREVHQFVHTDIVLIRPEERQGFQDILFMPERVVLIDVGTVLCHRGVGNHEQLNEPEQTTEGEPSVAVNLVHCLVDFDTRALQFCLHKRQTVNQDGDIVTILVQDISLVGRVHCHLMRDLIDISRLIVGEEYDIHGLSVIEFQHPLLTQYLCGFVNGMVFKAYHYTVKLCVREFRHAFCCYQFLGIQLTKLLPEVGAYIVIVL